MLFNHSGETTHLLVRWQLSDEVSKYMAKVENLEPPRDGLIRQEIISHEEDQKGLITVKRVIRHYHEDCMDFIEFHWSEPKKFTMDEIRKIRSLPDNFEVTGKLNLYA